MNETNGYQEKCKSFRYTQAFLLLLLVITFVIYLVVLIADLVVYHGQTGFLILTLNINLLAMAIIAIGIRGVALEVFPFVVAFSIVAAIVTVGQATTFAFRSPLLTTCNFLLDLAITVLGFIFSWMLYKDLLSRGGATVTVIPNICIVKKADTEEGKEKEEIDMKDNGKDNKEENKSDDNKSEDK